MSKKRSFHRLLAVMMAAILLVTGSAVWTASAATKAELDQKLEVLRKQESQLKKQLANASSDLTASQQRKNLIDSQIANTRQQIELLDSQVESVEAQITKAESEIADKKAAIADTREKLGARMRAIAKRGNVSTLQMLLDTENYTDYLLKSKAMQLIAEQDQATIDAYEAEMAKISAEQDVLEEKKAELESSRAASTAKKKELDTLYAAAQSEVRKLQSTVSGYNSQLAAKKKEMEATEREITRLIQNTASTGKYNAKMMYWPVPTVRVVSSVFGERWGTMHRGIDIANGPVPIYGQNIVAAADGTVIYANSTSDWGGGFGYYCIVDHGLDSKGRGVTTLYAHCSVMYARVGQKVVGGKTVLAKAGSTGNVTGPHLHFEVRLNGLSVDPMDPKNPYVNPKVN